jgi:hypothetical protein
MFQGHPLVVVQNVVELSRITAQHHSVLDKPTNYEESPRLTASGRARTVAVELQREQNHQSLVVLPDKGYSQSVACITSAHRNTTTGKSHARQLEIDAYRVLQLHVLHVPLLDRELSHARSPCRVWFRLSMILLRRRRENLLHTCHRSPRKCCAIPHMYRRDMTSLSAFRRFPPLIPPGFEVQSGLRTNPPMHTTGMRVNKTTVRESPRHMMHGPRRMTTVAYFPSL